MKDLQGGRVEKMDSDKWVWGMCIGRDRERMKVWVSLGSYGWVLLTFGLSWSLCHLVVTTWCLWQKFASPSSLDLRTDSASGHSMDLCLAGRNPRPKSFPAAYHATVRDFGALESVIVKLTQPYGDLDPTNGILSHELPRRETGAWQEVKSGHRYIHPHNKITTQLWGKKQ